VRSGLFALAVLAAAAVAGLGAAFLTTSGARAGPSPCADVAQSSGSTTCPPTDTTTTTTTTTTGTTTTGTTTTTDTTTTETTPTVTTPTPTPKPRPKPTPKPAPKPTKPKTSPKPHPKPAGPSHKTPPLGAGPYVFPVYGPVAYSDTFGTRVDTGWHHGDEIFAPLGAPVLAVADGTLFLVGYNPTGGNRVWLRDSLGNYFYYAHLAAFSTAAVDGAHVQAGSVLGFVGATGDAAGTPYHLHFEIHPATLLAFGYDGGAVDPTKYLRVWQRAAGIRLTTDDLKLTQAAGWSASVALPRAEVQPAAILLQSSDISSAPTLDAQAVARAFSPVSPERRIAAVKLPKLTRPPAFHLTAAARRQALRAEGLDKAASLPPGFPALTVWDALSHCEASGDWSANTGNGFYGGLQFTAQTWLENGGTAYAPSADQATREQQIAIAQRVLATQGWIAWPVCSVKLGLR
jgi:murein DD-endopeptidase MepM/ murein hydrolase activator NlpD